MTARHAVRAEVPNERVAGDWEAARIGQVLQNLLGNAIKYAPDHSESVARLAPRDGTGDVRVSAVDQGPGVPREALPHLFDRFYRAPPAAPNGTPGLGLGLYISRMLVEAHGGRIWAEPAGVRHRLPLHAARPAVGRGAGMTDRSPLPTGVPNLDLVLGGGLRRGALAIMMGPPGSGKTILASQMAFAAARRGERALVLTALSEPTTKILEHWRMLRSSTRSWSAACSRW